MEKQDWDAEVALGLREYHAKHGRASDAVAAVVARESVEDALLIVGSYGPWGVDLNDAHRRQIVLADEVLRLRSALHK